MDANNPEGTGPTAYTVEQAAEAISGLLSDDLETDNDAFEDNQDDDADAEEVTPDDADEAEDDDTEAEEPEDEAEIDGPIQFNADMKIQLEDGSVVSLGELNSGNLRQADYTRKTQEVAQVRKEFEAKEQQVIGAAQSLVQQYEVLQQFYAQSAPQQPTPTLWAEDPYAAGQQQAAYQQHSAAMQHIQSQLQQAQAYTQQQEQAKRQERLQKAAQDLFQWQPALQDPEKRRAFGQKLAQDAAGYGFTYDELDQLDDVRIIRALSDAAKYQALQSAKPKVMQKAQKAPPVTKQQRQSPRGRNERELRKNMDRLRKTGREEDAFQVIKDLI